MADRIFFAADGADPVKLMKADTHSPSAAKALMWDTVRRVSLNDPSDGAHVASAAYHAFADRPHKDIVQTPCILHVSFRQHASETDEKCFRRLDRIVQQMARVQRQVSDPRDSFSQEIAFCPVMSIISTHTGEHPAQLANRLSDVCEHRILWYYTHILPSTASQLRQAIHSHVEQDAASRYRVRASSPMYDDLIAASPRANLCVDMRGPYDPRPHMVHRVFRDLSSNPPLF